MDFLVLPHLREYHSGSNNQLLLPPPPPPINSMMHKRVGTTDKVHPFQVQGNRVSMKKALLPYQKEQWVKIPLIFVELSVTSVSVNLHCR